jgi:transposase
MNQIQEEAMRFAKVNSKYYCGVDLHSRTMYICVMDKQGNILFHRNMDNNFQQFKAYLEPFLPSVAVGVESSCFYYWLADKCKQANIDFYLGHAFYMKAINGGKVKNDRVDSRKIADLLRANLFPLAYPYPSNMRATRDLLRRRHFFVRRRAGTYTHLQILCMQYGMYDVTSKLVKNPHDRLKLLRYFDNPDIRMMIKADIDYLQSLQPIIDQLEKQIRKQTKYHNERDYQLLMTIPGVGDMLGLVILYETHDINRFPTVQQYSSYSGVVKCERRSAGKIIGAKNNKIRNPYLKWAFGDVILKAQIVHPKIEKLYQRLQSKYGPGRAKSIIAHRFAVAAYFMLKNQQVFDVDRFCQSAKYN